MFRTIATLMLIAALLAGCKPAAPSADYDIKGNISNVEPADGQLADVLGRIRIEGEKVEGNRYDKAIVAVSKSTRIWEKKGDGYVKASWDDLQFGALVTARFTGPVMESYPVQASASEIVILARMPRQ
ncbi:MAG: hypothetical protein H5T65_07885 [Chloroflexi bacterium]|nr:hypothetical protein [Chloroflexota bacterium]